MTDGPDPPGRGRGRWSRSPWTRIAVNRGGGDPETTVPYFPIPRWLPWRERRPSPRGRVSIDLSSASRWSGEDARSANAARGPGRWPRRVAAHRREPRTGRVGRRGDVPGLRKDDVGHDLASANGRVAAADRGPTVSSTNAWRVADPTAPDPRPGDRVEAPRTRTGDGAGARRGPPGRVGPIGTPVGACRSGRRSSPRVAWRFRLSRSRMPGARELR
jgi:hypothetical protein